MKLGVIGAGYVGLVTGACLAESGNSVICMDIDERKVESLSGGEPHIYEPGLKDLLERNLREGRIKFTTDLEETLKESFIIFIAVSTPQSDDGSADISAVMDVAKSIGQSIAEYKIIVTKSTVPVGTAEKIKEEISKHTKVDFDVASNPEFLKEGAAVEDFMKPDRVVIGVDNPEVGEILRELYQPFMRSGDRALIVSIRPAELAKYAANAMLATRISFMNEIANLCELIGADVSEVRAAVGADNRIGRHFLFPGVGYGGSCFPKDVKALIHTAKDNGYDLKICSSTDEVNALQKEIFWKKIYNYFDGNLEGKNFAIWGLSFKPKTDDIREAPALYVMDKILAHGGVIAAHDPAAMDNVKQLYNEKIDYVNNNYDACEGADALIIMTEWNEYRQPDFDKLKAVMAGNAIFDGRNLYNPTKLHEMGFHYFAVGRGLGKG